jgi:hypothetical protein
MDQEKFLPEPRSGPAPTDQTGFTTETWRSHRGRVATPRIAGEESPTQRTQRRRKDQVRREVGPAPNTGARPHEIRAWRICTPRDEIEHSENREQIRGRTLLKKLARRITLPE